MVITDEGVRIDLPVLESLHRRDIKVKYCYVMLYPEYVEYKNDYTCFNDDYNDQEGIWKETRSNYRFTRLRRNISEVTMYFENVEEMWMVAIDFIGISGSTGWLYHDPKEAIRLYTQLQGYHIGR